jgi:hypothetical protein
MRQVSKLQILSPQLVSKTRKHNKFANVFVQPTLTEVRQDSECRTVIKVRQVSECRTVIKVRQVNRSAGL